MKQEFFTYRGKELYCEEIPAKELAGKFGTPLYVYSASHLKARCRDFEEALGAYPHRVCFAVKACSNLSVLELFAMN